MTTPKTTPAHLPSTAALLVLQSLTDGPQSLNELALAHQSIKMETLRSAANRLVTKGYVIRIREKTWEITAKGHDLLAGKGHMNNYRPPTREEIDDNKPRNVPWVHPIRARILAPSRAVPCRSTR